MWEYIPWAIAGLFVGLMWHTRPWKKHKEAAVTVSKKKNVQDLAGNEGFEWSSFTGKRWSWRVSKLAAGTDGTSTLHDGEKLPMVLLQEIRDNQGPILEAIKANTAATKELLVFLKQAFGEPE